MRKVHLTCTPKLTYEISLGYTLLEVLIALTIVATILMWAIPFGQDFLSKNRLCNREEEIISALHFSRHQALLLKKELTLSPQPEGWSSGMILFIDKDNNHRYEEGETLLFQWKWKKSDFSIGWNGLYSDYLLFTPTSLTSVLGGTFTICSIPFSACKNIVMNRLGRIRVEEV